VPKTLTKIISVPGGEDQGLLFKTVPRGVQN
jgi:hypothetical protein